MPVVLNVPSQLGIALEEEGFWKYGTLSLVDSIHRNRAISLFSFRSGSFTMGGADSWYYATSAK